MKGNVFDFKAVDEGMCILKTQTKFHSRSFINVHVVTEEKVEI